MAWQPCGECHGKCPLGAEGFSNLHHPYKQCEANTPLRRVFSNLVENTVQLPVCVHREIEALYGWLDWPTKDVMLDIVTTEHELGNITLSANQLRKLRL